MAGNKVDPGWISGYAKTVQQSASTLEQQKKLLNAGHLPAAAFGELGKQLHTADSYTRASATLLDQLSKAAVALDSVAEQLGKVAGEHADSEAENAAVLNRSKRD